MRWTYGDEVAVVTANEREAFQTRPGVVVAITTVESLALSSAVAWPVGTILYTVEFEDGSDALIPEAKLLPLKELLFDEGRGDD